MRTSSAATISGRPWKYSIAQSIDGPYNFSGLRCPFLCATNGEVVWFHDVRHALNRSRRVSGFHTPSALGDLLDRDFDAASEKLLALPNVGSRPRPYQRDANAAVEKVIAERKRNCSSRWRRAPASRSPS
jgi:type I restriction enzyme, R subunit